MERQYINSLLEMPVYELVNIANEIRAKRIGQKMELCSIMNAKSGLCSEDCRFCAQAAKHSAEIAVYPLKAKEEMLKQAFRAKEIGAERFGIVTSGPTVNRKELLLIADTISEICEKVGIEMCASLGRMDEGGLRILKEAGLGRYHHNIETSSSYYPNIVTTYDFNDRLNTIKAAKKVGLQVCSGGIIGLGETFEDRIEMALLLKELDVDSIPINILVPIKGTPLENRERLSCVDAIRTIAIFRIILEDKIIKIAAGRELLLKDFQALAFLAGANGMLIGGYLTIKGRAVEEDRKLISEIKEIWRT